MSYQSGNKTIAKNTIYLYLRMMVTMVISLYTSRVILQILGVDDFGIYQAVGGIVGLLSFINSALSIGSSRFLTFGLGEGDENKLRNIFSTTLTAHVILALAVVLLAETVGLWFLYHKMVIPEERMGAAVFAFHLSIVTAFFSITQVPYNACIIAHERMTVYAYVSIVEAVSKLVIVYLLTIGNIDKLKLYALLLCTLEIGVIVFYRFYCVRHFDEARFRLSMDKGIFKEIAGFSGWSLIASGSVALKGHGILILLNMFFAPAVVSARALSIQVNIAANQFVANFQTAATPQIVKRYAVKDYSGSKQLLLQTTKYSYFLMLLLALPILLAADWILRIWLGTVPEYTTIFLQIIIVQSLFQIFDVSFYRALYAKGQLKENALISPMLSLLSFPVVYVLFRLGYSPVVLSWVSLATSVLVGVVIKPILIVKIVDYKWSEILEVFRTCIIVTLAALPIPLLAFFRLGVGSVLNGLIVVGASVSCVAVSIWFLGLDKSMRNKLIQVLLNKFPFVQHHKS